MTPGSAGRLPAGPPVLGPSNSVRNIGYVALTPGERITLIKRIAAALDNESWGDLNLALSEFGVQPPGDASWSDNYDYVIKCLPSAADRGLVDLHAYLYPDAD